MAATLGLRRAIEDQAGTDINDIAPHERIALARRLARRHVVSSSGNNLELLQKDTARRQRQLAKLQIELHGYRAALANLPPTLRLAARSKISALEERIAVLESAS